MESKGKIEIIQTGATTAKVFLNGQDHKRYGFGIYDNSHSEQFSKIKIDCKYAVCRYCS